MASGVKVKVVEKGFSVGVTAADGALPADSLVDSPSASAPSPTAVLPGVASSS